MSGKEPSSDQKSYAIIDAIADAVRLDQAALTASLCYQLVSTDSGRRFAAGNLAQALRWPERGPESFWLHRDRVAPILHAWPGSNGAKAAAWEPAAAAAGFSGATWLLEIMDQAMSARPLAAKLLGAALRQACLAGRADAVEDLLCLGAPTASRDITGVGPLMLAALEGHMRICQALIDFGASTMDVDSHGRDALAICRPDKREELTSIIEQSALASTPKAGAKAPKKPMRI